MGNDLFSSSSPSPITKRHELYGYKWQIGLNLNTALRGFDIEGDYELPAGIVVGFKEQHVQSPEYYFGDELDTVPVFNAVDASTQLKSMIKTIEEKRKETISTDKTLNLLQGYLEYTNKCLNWIYATGNGKTLLDALMNGRYNVNIVPTMRSNSYQNAVQDDALSFVAGKIRQSSWRCEEDDRETILQTLANASNESDRNNQYRWLAHTINYMPLYSLFKTPPYEYSRKGFINRYWLIKSEYIENWFTQGNRSAFAAQLENHDRNVKGVNLTDYIRMATIIALHEASPAGSGSGVGITFDVRAYTNGSDSNSQRPPAIGLAHELVHAYYSASGKQPGMEIFDISTLLAELLCVGLGPWAENNISENGIRAQWDPNTIGNGINHYRYDNIDMRVRPRNVYEPTTDNDTSRRTMRNRYRTI